MKNFKYLFLLFAILGLSFSSCNKDDDDPSFDEQLEGEWFVTLVSYANCDDPADDETIALPSNCDADNCYRFNFNDNGTLVLYYKEDGDVDVQNGTYSGDEDALTICNDGDCITGTMDIDDDEAIFLYEEDGCDVTFTFER